MRGITAELVTPYSSYGGIDTDGVGRLVERAIAGGVAAILLNGPIGEGPHLSRGERLFVIEAAIEAAAGRVPLYAATGAVGAEETLALTWDAGKAGIAAAFVAPPFYYRLSQEAIVAHYRAIARRARLPLVVHNLPSPLGNTLTPASLAALAAVEGIAAIAQADESAHLTETLHLLGGRLPLLAARDELARMAMEVGAAGLVSAIAGIAPVPIVAMERASATGDHREAQRHWETIQPLTQFLSDPSLGVAACKAALTALGLPGGEPRAPLPPLDADAQARVSEAILALAEGAGSPGSTAPNRATITLLPDQMPNDA